MSQTKRERKKIAKKQKRRKAYEKVRNYNRGRKKVQTKDVQVTDGAEFYRKLKEKEAAEKAQQHPKQEKKGNVFTRLLSRVTKGRQK
jgi:uncharacterized Fe-S cluster-containing radical SAM superfamily enzyme